MTGLEIFLVAAALVLGLVIGGGISAIWHERRVNRESPLPKYVGRRISQLDLFEIPDSWHPPPPNGHSDDTEH